MILKQYYLGCLAHASYLIADEQTKTAAVVDPQRDIEQYLRDAEAGRLLDSIRGSHSLPCRFPGRATSNCGTGPGRRS